MTDVLENKAHTTNDTAFLALKLIVQNFLSKKINERPLANVLNLRVKKELGITRNEIVSLGKYLSEVYQKDMIVEDIDMDTTLQQLLDKYFIRMKYNKTY